MLDKKINYLTLSKVKVAATSFCIRNTVMWYCIIKHLFLIYSNYACISVLLFPCIKTFGDKKASTSVPDFAEVYQSCCSPCNPYCQFYSFIFGSFDWYALLWFKIFLGNVGFHPFSHCLLFGLVLASSLSTIIKKKFLHCIIAHITL